MVTAIVALYARLTAIVALYARLKAIVALLARNLILIWLNSQIFSWKYPCLSYDFIHYQVARTLTFDKRLIHI